MKHTLNCTRIFKRYDADCGRCRELSAGAKLRDSYHKRYFEDKAAKEQAFTRALKAHNCQINNCGPVCTAFDW